MDVLLATGEQTTIALTAMAINALGKRPFADRRPGGHHHRWRPYQGEDREHHAEADAQASQRRQHRDRRRLPGRDSDGPSPPSGAAAAISPRSPSPRRSRRTLPDLYRRGRRLHCDPRIVPTPARSTRSPTTRCSRWPRAAPKVMQSRSVEFAKKFGVIFEVRSSFNTTQEPS